MQENTWDSMISFHYLSNQTEDKARFIKRKPKLKISTTSSTQILDHNHITTLETQHNKIHLKISNKKTAQTTNQKKKKKIIISEPVEKFS